MEPRNYASGASATPPTAPVSPSVGYPISGSPGGPTAATKPGPFWYYKFGEELRKVITDAGLTPSDADLGQLSQAIQAMIAAGGAKVPVRAATTANIATLAGGAPSTLDGVALAANDRILVKDQSTGSQNGLYVVTTLGTGANGSWTRATDADGAGEVFAGMLVTVTEGTTYADSLWELATDGAITVGTTSLSFVLRATALASSAEAQAQSNALKAITPATLAAALQGSNQSLAANGYQKLPGGVIVQWGVAVPTTGAGAAVSFPIAFPTACRCVTTGIGNSTETRLAALTPSTTGFNFFCATGGGSSHFWFALGY